MSRFIQISFLKFFNLANWRQVSSSPLFVLRMMMETSYEQFIPSNVLAPPLDYHLPQFFNDLDIIFFFFLFFIMLLSHCLLLESIINNTLVKE